MQLHLFYRVVSKDNPSEEAYTCCQIHSKIADAKEAGKELQDKHRERHWFVQTVIGFRNGPSEKWRYASEKSEMVEIVKLFGKKMDFCGAFMRLDEFLERG